MSVILGKRGRFGQTHPQENISNQKLYKTKHVKQAINQVVAPYSDQEENIQRLQSLYPDMAQQEIEGYLNSCNNDLQEAFKLISTNRNKQIEIPPLEIYTQALSNILQYCTSREQGEKNIRECLQHIVQDFHNKNIPNLENQIQQYKDGMMAMLKENKTLKHGVRKLYCDGKRVRDLERENEGLRNQLTNCQMENVKLRYIMGERCQGDRLLNVPRFQYQ